MKTKVVNETEYWNLPADVSDPLSEDLFNLLEAAKSGRHVWQTTIGKMNVLVEKEEWPDKEDPMDHRSITHFRAKCWHHSHPEYAKQNVVSCAPDIIVDGHVNFVLEEYRYSTLLHENFANRQGMQSINDLLLQFRLSSNDGMFKLEPFWGVLSWKLDETLQEYTKRISELS